MVSLEDIDFEESILEISVGEDIIELADEMNIDFNVAELSFCDEGNIMLIENYEKLPSSSATGSFACQVCSKSYKIKRYYEEHEKKHCKSNKSS